MSAPDDLADRDAFARRIQRQLQARYGDVDVAIDSAGNGLRLVGPGIDAQLPLTPLHNACLRRPDEAPQLIAAFVRDAEYGLAPRSPMALSLARVLWCVRTTDYLAEHSRERELLTRPVAGSLVAFVAESLPNSVMRGVANEQWAPAGEAAVRDAADVNTARHFERAVQRIREAARLPGDGFQFSGGSLFQGSMLVAPAVLRALADRAGSEVLLAVPDRSLVLAVAAGSSGAPAFRHRVTRAFREALNPCSRELLITDGADLSLLAQPARRVRTGVFGWLRD